MSTPEKKEKYKAQAKAMATKLAFKNLKSQLFKNNDAWLTNDSSSPIESTSEGENTAADSSADSPKSPNATIVVPISSVL